MRVLLFDTSAYYPISPHFLEALQRLAARSNGALEYDFVDEAAFTRPRASIVRRLVRRALGHRAVDLKALNEALLHRARSFKPDIVVVGKGASIIPATLSAIKADTGATLVNYATDDPFNPRVTTQELLQSIPLYDLYACTKRAIMDEVVRTGCSRVIYLPFGYKPELHFPEAAATETERRKFESDVAFIGGCDWERAPLFSALIKAMPNLNLALYGQHWNRWPRLRRYGRGFALGRDFRLALGGTKIAINLVRHTNRDDHAMRTFEIPACGAFMLAERTASQVKLFPENVVAAYFNGASELVAAVGRFLADRAERELIRERAHRLLRTTPCSYEDRLVELLSCAAPHRHSSDQSPWDNSCL
jgi:spore maturation protein CgeB